ncbi:hypothetical protein ACN28C_02805 [Plantactinospora sp. WMMC1484]
MDPKPTSGSGPEPRTNHDPGSFHPDESPPPLRGSARPSCPAATILTLN